ncbi:diguanylate cyclase (GGDEF) domain-containing protein [Pseudobutyrivibrio sp. YE44]|uniref:GGDEF domain-containing protein n=1 Tax=Pseudobutyrivibrio sp. YE44 TaxID=1520802 RepID=UPI000892346C|nr:GGDEF domain-containing protein [Pseudobutyrivibrio sp. YE44]SDB51540.1 diguanylate cyclase (GGDEF) domain-containing protein [Pseudobutyrivibrio sp. YE44]
MDRLKKYIDLNSEELELIRQYFRECLETINDNNLYMLRKTCMYIALVYCLMLVIVNCLISSFTITWPHLLIIPLLLVYFNVNLYTLKHRGEISTGKTAAICCSFYFLLGVYLGIIDVFQSVSTQALWLPIAVIALPMIFIDRIYKYGFEELVVLSIMLILSFFNKPREIFMRDVYISVSAYFISILSARIILEMRARETLAIAEVTRLSALDKLTHVLNKGALLQRIESYFETKIPSEYCAMCVIDLDDFKLVNDNLGHNIGDVLLEQVGNLLSTNFRAYDIVGRYGGDEFIVVMPKMSDQDILKARCKALQMFISEIELPNNHRVTASIGAILNNDVLDVDSVFSMADDALYKSKIQGKNCCTVWKYRNEPVDKPVLLVMTSEEHQGIIELKEDQGERFEIILAKDDDEALRDISEYQKDLKIIFMELNMETGLGVFALKYLKTREAFANIPILAIVNSDRDYKMARELGVDDVLQRDTPNPVFKKNLEKLIGC